MREKTIVPTNLLDWPRCADLLPEQKLILLWLWCCQWLSCAGVGIVPPRPAAATLGLSPEALMGGLKDLARRKLIIVDGDSGEIFICDWFRFHEFKSPVGVGTLASAIKKIQSGTIKDIVIEKSVACLPTAAAKATASPSPAAAAPEVEVENKAVLNIADPTKPKPPCQPEQNPNTPSKLVMRNEADQALREVLIDEFGLEAVEAEAELILREGKPKCLPWPSRVQERLVVKRNAAAAVVQQAKAAANKQAQAVEAEAKRFQMHEVEARFNALTTNDQDGMHDRFLDLMREENKVHVVQAFGRHKLNSAIVRPIFFEWFNQLST